MKRKSTEVAARSGRRYPARRQRAARPEGVASGSLALPHERDEGPAPTEVPRSDLVEQASRDLERGLVDTDKAPQMDRIYRRIKE
ncbi:MAG: hypothetical protein ABI794_06625 [Betaproteobacteria bacterium]